ncbi:MAG: COG3650 family protein [bacterium]
MKKHIRAFRLIVGLSLLMGALFSPSLFAEELYAVRDVAVNDYLNVRAQAGTKAMVITMIPHDATTVRLTGQEKQLGRSTWVKVLWQSKQGWVNRRYLIKAVEQIPVSAQKPTTSEPTLRCGGTEPFWSIDVSRKTASFKPMDGENMSLPVTFRSQSANNPTIAAVDARNKERNITLFLQKVAECSDGMSDINYPFRVTTIINNKAVYSGCCHQQ